MGRVVDPASVRWIGFSHFESDALNEWFRVAPRAQAVCRHRIDFLSTPHVPHCWYAGLFFDRTERTPFCSDLFFHPGDPPPVTGSNVVGPARESIVKGLAGPMRNDMPFAPYTESTLERLASLAPRTLALMHGSTFTGDGGAAIRALARVITDTLGPHPAR